jgi:hypothetical protein
VVEHLLCKCEALGSNHSPPEKRKKEEGRKEGKKGGRDEGNKRRK